MCASSNWRRFIGSCGTPAQHNQPGSGHLLRKSPSEWQRYAVLLRTCPVSRVALLDYLTPIFVDYFVVWWQRNAQTDRPSRAIDTSNEILEDLYTAETMLCKLVQLLRELVSLPNISEQFVSAVCAWCLARLRPVCMIPPTQLLAQLRRTLQSAALNGTRSRASFKSAGHRSDRTKGRKRTGPESSRRVTKLTVREGSPFGDGPGALQRFTMPASPSDSEVTTETEEEDEAEDQEDDDDQDEEGGDGGDNEGGEEVGECNLPAASVSTTFDVTGKESSGVTKDSKLLLDFNPDSSANRQLLGIWSRCSLLMDMLHLTYELLLGSCSRLSTVQTLLASASIPVPPELTSVTNYHPPPTSVLPHWVITWLTYQSYRMLHAGHPGSIRQLVRSVLESATLPPPLPMPNTQAAWAMLDTVASWYDEKRVDTQFWISSCLTHLLFLGDETPQLVYQWLMEQLELMLHQSDIDRNSSNASRSIGVIHVLLRLGLATVPIPPSVPTALELNAISQSGPPTSAPGPVGGSGPSVANTAVSTNAVNTTPFIALNLGRRFPAPVNYSGFPLHPADFFGGNPAGAMPQAAAGSMPPYYPQPMQQHPVPGAAPFPLSNQPPRSMFDTGPPQRSGSGPQNMAIGPLPPTVLQPPPPPTSLYPNTVQSTRLSSHRSRRHGVQSQASGPVSSSPTTTEWTVCTPTRQPASLVWLLNLAKLLRLTSVTALARALSLLFRESTQCADIEHRLSRTIDYCQLSAESPVLFHLATQILLTAPAGPGYKQLLTFLLETVSDSKSESVPASFGVLRSVCGRLLQSAAVTCLSMVHSSSECADSLNRGGCEGLLRAARLLTRTPLGGPRDTTRSTGSRALLFDLMIDPDPLISLIATQILVALSLTIEPTLAQEILFELCCCNSTKLRCTEKIDSANKMDDAKTSVKCQTTPLLLFFPILDELETGWATRQVSVGTNATTTDQIADVPWIASELLYHSFDDPITYQPSRTAAYLVHELLAFHLLPRVWDLIGRESNHQRTVPIIQAVIWLLCREELLVRNRLAKPRLHLALRAQLKPLLTLLNSQVEFTELTELLLTLFEFALTDHNCTPRESNRSGSSTRRSTSVNRPVTRDYRQLSPRLAYQIGQRLIQLAAKLLHRRRQSISAQETASLSRLLARIEHLLLPPVELYGGIGGGALLRSTALHELSTTDSLQLVDPGYECEADVANADRRIRLRDLDEQLVDIRYIPADSSHPLLSSSSSLLIFNPPVSSHNADADDLTRGYLRAPLSRLDRRGSLGQSHCRVETANTSGASVLSKWTFASENSSNTLLSCPNWLHWLRLADRLCLNQSSSTLSHDPYYQSLHVDWLATALQHSFLPHGLHLPQTSVWQLPEQIPLVLSPAGLGLERVIRLMHQFCPQVKAGAIRGLTEERCQDIREHEPMWLSQALFTTPLSVLCTTEHIRSLPRPSPELGDSSDARTVYLLDPFSLPDQDHLPLVHFPYPRLVLGLLQGLEVAWASPLAPRISISDAVTFLTRRDGAFAQGVFPVVGASELCIFHARKLAVDYCQRRVDCRTDLFRFTKQLLMSLFVICHGQDCASLSRMRSEQKLADTREQGVTCYPPHLPLDRLLYCLNPREMSILLSDVRRNLRLRLAFEWLRNDRLPGVSHPLAVIATKTMDALGGGPVPPAPAFITPGLLLALLQSHLMEPGVANLVGPLFTAVRLLQSAADTAGSVESTGVTGAIDGDADSVVEEIDVNGELVVVLND